jgi:hypothetical protein
MDTYMNGYIFIDVILCFFKHIGRRKKKKEAYLKEKKKNKNIAKNRERYGL